MHIKKKNDHSNIIKQMFRDEKNIKIRDVLKTLSIKILKLFTASGQNSEKKRIETKTLTKRIITV